MPNLPQLRAYAHNHRVTTRTDAPDLRAKLEGMHGTCTASAARRAARYLSAAYDHALAPTGLNVGQFSLLHAIALHGPLALGELATHVATDRTTLGKNLKPLERDGLVTTETSEHDRRVREVSITDAGLDRFLAAIDPWERAQAEFEAEFGANRADALRGELRGVLETGLHAW